MEPAREGADVATGAVATVQSSERRALVTAIAEWAAAVFTSLHWLWRCTAEN